MQKFQRKAVERGEKTLPFAFHPEISVRYRAQIALISFGRENPVGDVGGEIEHAAVGVINENECRLTNFNQVVFDAWRAGADLLIAPQVAPRFFGFDER